MVWVKSKVRLALFRNEFMSKLFNIKNETDVKYINNIRKTATQISLDKVKEYRNAIGEYLEFVGKEVQEHLGVEYYVVMVYYSYLIEDTVSKRITKRVADRTEDDYILNLKAWYDKKWDNFEAFSLVPMSLGSHKNDKKPTKYLVKFFDSSNSEPLKGICDEIPFYCYDKPELWEGLHAKIVTENFDAALEELKRFDAKGIDFLNGMLSKGFTIGGNKPVNKIHLLPYMMVWYPIYRKGWRYQYYIPSPMYSNTPIGGLVIGTKELFDEDGIYNLEDIALKVSVDINFIEHKEKVLQYSKRNALAAIMVRNMSHNIGSHVLSKLSNEDSFYGYLQGRSDMIAEISIARPSWAPNMRFINDVIDNFIGSSGK